jgi:hypothetical protein
MTTTPRLSELTQCFQGVIPSFIATSDAHGVPNVTYLSQVYFVDDRHVALSCQFFNKTRRNLDANPFACVELMDPLTLQAYRLRLRFLRSEKSGPLYDTMRLRIDAIASHTGMSGVFRLIAADVFEVLALELVDGFLVEGSVHTPAQDVSVDGLRSEMRGLHCVSARINRACDLEALLGGVLEALDEYFHFTHTSVQLYDDQRRCLVTLASHGYGRSGIGAEVALGEGLIGTAALSRRVLRMTTLDADMRYGRAIRREAAADHRPLDAEIPLPGLADAQSILVIPLSIGQRLIGVLTADDRDLLRFGEWHEAYLEIVGNQIALGIDRMLERRDDAPEPVEPAAAAPQCPAPLAPRRRRLTYYRNDDAVFLDGEYLIRNVPARILRKVLTEWSTTGRTEFSNRELRLDETLGLPPVKDNLESRLILLRHRLKEKCPDLQLVPTARGRFALQVGAAIDIVER